MSKISVVIPVFNAEKYLQSCIDGCMAQTMQDIEYIFVNDASTDNSLSILKENAQRFPAMKVIDSCENRHVGGARNIGIAAAEGEYIGFVDADDIPLPRMYEQLYNKAEESNSDVCYIHSARIDETVSFDKIINKDVSSFESDIVWSKRTLLMANREMTDEDREWYMVKSPGHVWNAIWKRSLLEKADMSFPEHVAYEDNYWAGIVEAYVQRIDFVQEIAYLYRINPSSITQSRNNKNCYDRIINRDKLLNTAKERGLLDRLHNAYEYLYTYRDTFTTFRILATRFDYPNYKVMKQLILDLKKEFPNWKRNVYLKALISPRMRLENRCISILPGACGHVLHLLSK